MAAVRQCTPAEARQIFKGSGLFALLDVREQEEFSRGHMLLASSAPFSRLEFMVPALIPSKGVPVIVMDSGEEDDSRAVRAAERLRRMGYEQPLVLAGGLGGWRRAGYVVVEGVSSLAKGYAEYLEREKKTPGLTPEEIHKRLESGEKMVFIDIRVPEEYAGMALPGGINAPGCEAAYRFQDLVPSPDTLVVVNCAARTRGILCAQMLTDFGVPNRVVSLKGGTMNWRRSGFDLTSGLSRHTAPPSAKALAFAREHAAVLAKEQGISFVDAATVRQWQVEADTNPLYIFDVRRPEEYEAGHLPGSRCAQGGQLTQRSDEYAAVRNARFVMVDDTEVRAVITAYWLKQIAMPDVYVLKGGLGGSGFGREGLEYGPEPQPVVACSFDCGIGPEDLAGLLAEQKPPLLINVGYSDRHREGHIPGAVWVSRGLLERVHKKHFGVPAIVLTSDDETHARLAAADAQELWPEAEVRFLEGGTPGWREARLPLEAGMPVACSPEDDIWYLMYMEPDAPLAAMEDFFDWKLELAEQIVADGSYAFRLPGRPA